MTSRDRVAALLSGHPFDRVPLHDSPWWDALGTWMAQGYPHVLCPRKKGEKIWMTDGRQNEVEVDGEYPDPIPPWRHFGYDMNGVGGWFDYVPKRSASELIEETEEWEVRRNGAGAAFKYWKHKSGTPAHIDFLMTTRAVWERDYRPHLLSLDPLRLDIEGNRKSLAEARSARVWGFYGHLGIWECLRASLGDITLYESVLLDPGWIRDFGRVYTDFFKIHYDHLIQEAGKPDGIWVYDDLGYKCGLFASLQVLSNLIFPFYADLVSYFHSLDLPVVLHTCGSTLEALPMIVEAGFDALNPMERKAAGNDPFSFAERYGERLAFIGGLDARVLETNDLSVIEREVAAYIDGMKARGARFVFASDHSISPRVQYRSYLHALEIYREQREY